jgi:PmbA protein
LARYAEQAEVYTVESETTEIAFEAGEVKSALVEETSGVALRALVGGRVGFTAASGRADGEALVQRVVASAAFGEPLPLTLPAHRPAAEVTTLDTALAEVPLTDLVAIGREIIAILRASDPDAKVDVSVERSTSRARLRNSAGADTDERGSALQVSMSVERVRGDDVLMVYDSYSDIGLSDGYRAVAERLAEQVRLASRAARVESGRMPVLFTPSGTLVLLLPLLMGVNGENVQRGTSPLAGRRGEAILDPRLTLWDDPSVPRRPASSAYDDEGMPARRQALFERGALGTFLFDLKTAALAGTESTGNGHRGLFSLPSPSATNLVLEAGETPLQTLIGGIDHGLLVDSVLGLGQGNPLSGAFSNPVGLAYAIEHGEIAGRVKDVTLAGNAYDLLPAIGGLSVERHWAHGRYLLPYVLIPAVDVVHSATD